MENYNILRTAKFNTNTKITQVFEHLVRKNVEKNVNPELTKNNKILINSLKASTKDATTFQKKLNEFYAKKEIKVKKENVLLYEYIVSASPKFFENGKITENWAEEQLKFFKKEFGENLKFGVLHLDESTPHIHFLVSCEKTSVKKYKNRYGVTEKTTTTLNSKSINPEYLKSLHSRHADHNKIFGLMRGTSTQGEKVTHVEIKKYRETLEKIEQIEEIKLDKIIKNMDDKLGYVHKKDIEKTLTPLINNYNMMRNNYTTNKDLNMLNKQKTKELKEKQKLLTEEELNLAKIRLDLEQEIMKTEDLKIHYRKGLKEQQEMIDTITHLTNENKKLKEEINRKNLKINRNRTTNKSSNIPDVE